MLGYNEESALFCSVTISSNVGTTFIFLQVHGPFGELVLVTGCGSRGSYSSSDARLKKCCPHHLHHPECPDVDDASLIKPI